MRTLSKIKVAFILALTALLMFSAFAFTNIGNAKADEVEFVGDGLETFVMREDAEMRIYAEDDVNTSGLRFTVDIGSKLYDEKISALEEIYFVVGYAENFDAIEAGEDFDGGYAGVKGKKVTVPVANIFKAKTADDSAYTGAYRANVVIADIQDANYDKEFTAVAYYKDGDNAVWATRGADRSIKYLAESVYFDFDLDQAERTDWQADVKQYLGTGASAERAISVANTAEFTEMVNVGTETDYFALVADIDYGAISTSRSVYFDAFNTNLEGNNYALIYDLTAAESFGQGMFTYFNGSMNNVSINASFHTVIRQYEPHGAFAEVMNGSLTNSTLFVKTEQLNGYLTDDITAFKALGSTAKIENCIIEQNDMLRMIAKIAEDGATLKNIAFIGLANNDGYILPTTVINIENFYVYSSWLDLTNGNVKMKLNDEVYGAEGNTTHNASSLWIKSGIEKTTDYQVTGRLYSNSLNAWSKVEINSKEEFIAAMSSGTRKCYVLNTDINLTSEDLGDAAKDQSFEVFNGYLEGNGKTITVARDYVIQTFDAGGLFKDMNGIIKNAKFVLTYSTAYDGSAYYSAFARNVNGLIENCIIEATSCASIQGTGNYGAFQVVNGTIKNCVVWDKAGSLGRGISKEVGASSVIDGYVYVQPYTSSWGGTYKFLVPATDNGATISNYMYSANVASSTGDLFNVEAYKTGEGTLWAASSTPVVTGFNFTADGIFFATAE